MNTRIQNLLIALAFFAGVNRAAAQGTAFTYQGQLNIAGVPANGNFYLRFKMFDAPDGGVQFGSTCLVTPQWVTNGLFTALVDVGSVFDGTARYLEVAVATPPLPLHATNYLALTPRQLLTPTPYAVTASTALTASGLSPSGSANYVLKAGDTMSGTLNVSASVIAGGSGAVSGIIGKNGAGALSAPSYTGVYGVSYAGNGNGVSGEANSGSLAFGIYGKSSSGYAGFFDGKVQVNGNAAISSNLMAGGAVTAASFVGNGAGLTNLSFVGNGAGFTNLNAWLPTGNYFLGTAYLVNNTGPLFVSGSNGVTVGSSVGVYLYSASGVNISGPIISDALQITPITIGDFFSSSDYANVLGGIGSAVSSGVMGATVSGGGYSDYAWGFPSTTTWHINQVTGDFGSIGGGYDNVAGAEAVVSGGQGNQAVANLANIGGGFANTNKGPAAVIGGGWQNAIQASANNATLGGGSFNTISSGAWNAVIPGGDQNTVGANCSGSFAAGHRAKVNQPGSFIWADGNDFDFSSSIAQNQVRFRSTGGFDIVTGINATTGVPTTGVWMMTGDNSWRAISDRSVKKNIQPVDGAAVLDKLAQVPVSQWHYKWENDDTTLHFGPMAQDFIHAFYPGENDKSITTMQFDGVELAAIQGLNQKLEAEAKSKDAEIESLKQSVAELKKLVQAVVERK